MRTSTLSRSVMAVASLAIGSAVFAAVPATAATSNGVTREEVLAAAAALRADNNQMIDPSVPTQSALNALTAKLCGPNIEYISAQPVETPDSVDGLAVTAIVQSEGLFVTDPETRAVPSVSTCSFTAVATLDGATTFSGNAGVYSDAYYFTNPSAATDDVYKSFSLSGNVFVSPVVVVTNGFSYNGIRADGLVRSPDSKRVLTSTKIADKKTTAEKKAAKKAYAKRIKAIKKSYVTAKRKAGSNAEKKAIARMKYATRRASAKAAYRYAVADFKLVNRRTKVADERRFSVQAYAGIGA